MSENQYTLKLYISGITPENQQLVVDFKEKLRSQLCDKYELEVIDVLEHPELAEAEHIIVTPSLVKILPDNARQVILDFSSQKKLLIGVDILSL